MTPCACPCHKQAGPGYEGHPAPGEVPTAHLMIGLIGHNGVLAMPTPYCWACAHALTMKLLRHALQRAWPTVSETELVEDAVQRMMKYANEGGKA